MNRLESMNVLLAVVDAGSLSAAGRKLGMPLATVSRKVSELEAALKIQLLIRSTRGLALTESGRGYVVACRRILEDVHEAERAAAGEYIAPRGELIVTAPMVFGRLQVLPVLAEFLKAYHEVNVRLELRDRNVNLLEDHVDLALRIGSLPVVGSLPLSWGVCAGSSARAPAICPGKVYRNKFKTLQRTIVSALTYSGSERPGASKLKVPKRWSRSILGSRFLRPRRQSMPPSPDSA